MTCLIERIPERVLYARMTPEKMSACIRRDFGDIYQMELGATEAAPIHAIGDPLAIVSRQISDGVMRTHTVPGNAYHFALKGNLGESADAECDLIICAPGSAYDLNWSDGSYLLSMRINQGIVNNECDMQRLRLPRTGVATLRLNASNCESMVGLIDYFVQRDGYSASRRALECWVGLFLCEILNFTDQTGLRFETSALASEIDYFIQERLDGEFSVDQIGARFGLSSRQLHYCFKKQFGAGPVATIRKLKYGRARRDLQAALPGHTTVSEIAARWGFFEMSHFARQYKSLFGELPSRTLLNASPVAPTEVPYPA